MKIREANLADAAGIARVHIDSWRSTYAGIVPASHLAGFNYQDRSERWQQMLTNQQAGNFVYVAETDQGEIVGFATSGSEQDGHPVYKGELYAIYLLQTAQGRGLGKQLALTVAQTLRRHGYETMLVWVLADNPANGFYQALGGQRVAEKSITIGGAELTEIGYGWTDLAKIVDL